MAEDEQAGGAQARPDDEPKRPEHMAFHWELPKDPDGSEELPAWFSGAEQAGDTVWDVGHDFSQPRALSTRDGRSMVVGVMDDAGDIGCLSLPRQISREGGSLRLFPAAEVDALHTFEASLDPHAGGLFQHHRADLRFDGIQPGHAMLALDNAFELELKDGTLLFGFVGDYDEGHGRPTRALEVGALESLRLIVDDTTVECFINGGRQAFSTRWFPVTRTMLLTMKLDCLSAKAYGMADGVRDLYTPLM